MSEEDEQMNEPQDQPQPDQPQPDQPPESDFDQVDFGEPPTDYAETGVPEAGVQEVPVGEAFVPAGDRLSTPLVKRAVMLGGALLLLVAFFLPWWSVDVRTMRLAKWDDEEQMKLAEIALDNADWYIDHLYTQAAAKRIVAELEPYLRDMIEFEKKLKEYYRSDDDKNVAPFGGRRGSSRRPQEPTPPTRLSLSVYASDTSLGSFVLITALIVAAVAAAWWFLPGAAQCIWLGDLVAVVLTAIAVVCGAFWCILCPGEDIGTGFRQGLSVGPFLVLAGSLCVLVPGIMNVLPRLKELRAKPPVGRPIA